MTKRSFIILTLFLVCVVIRAQQGLNINALFNGTAIQKADLPGQGVVEVKVKGKALSQYRLTFYHSYRFVALPTQEQCVSDLFEKDKKNAVTSETVKTKQQTTSIILMPPLHGLNRFVCYVVKKGKRQSELTVVYMEGAVKDIAELRKLIK